MRHSLKNTVFFALTIVGIIVLMVYGLSLGSIELTWAQILDALFCPNDSVASFAVNEVRLPALVTSLFAGAALAVAGLMMQTCFNNPLAGPSIMGISSGASLGVAVVVLALGGMVGQWGRMAVVGGAFLGAMVVLGALMLFSLFVASADVLLIVGILIGYLSSSIVSILNFFAPEAAVHSYVVWGLGNFSSVAHDELALFCGLCLMALLISGFFIKGLNAMLFGTDYAASVGVSVVRVRTALLILAGILTAVVTAWCGPIGFLGLIVPHIARMILCTSNHAVILPATALCGALLGLVTQVISTLPALQLGSNIPVNAITPFIGVPIIIYVLLNRRKLLYFN